MTTENNKQELILLHEDKENKIFININNIDEHNNIVNKIHRRGLNRNLTEDEIIKRNKELQKKRNLKYYLKHIETIRKNNLNNYHKKKKNKKRIGRPKKYNIE